MITTCQSYAMPFFLQVGKEFSQGWKCVDLDLNIPYFFIAYELTAEEDVTNIRKIISIERDVPQFCLDLQADPLCKLRQLSIIAPSWLNQTNRWQMIDIVEIRCARFAEDGISVNVYLNAIGQKLTTSMHPINLEEATQIDFVLSVH